MSENNAGLQALNTQNPTLIPNLYQPIASAGGGVALQSPADMLTANPRAAAACSLTLTTNPSNGNVLTLTLTNPVLVNGSLAVSVTASSDTTTTICEKLAAALNANLVAMSTQIYASSLSGVLTVNELGPVGNSTAVVLSSNGSTTSVYSNQPVGHVVVGGSETDDDVITLRFSNANFSGGHEDISHTAAGAESLTSIATALKVAINADVVLAANGITATSSGQDITVNQTGPNFATMSYTVGSNTETLTITGSSGLLQGGTGPVIPVLNFVSAQGPSILRFQVGQPVILSAPELASLIAAGSPII